MDQLLASLSFLGDFTTSVVAAGVQAEQAVLASPVGHALDQFQALVVQQIEAVYPEFPTFVDNFAKEYRFPYHQDVKVALMNPFHVVLIVLAYIVLVYGGMAVMSLVRTKFELKFYGILHNLTLTLISLYMCVEIWRQSVILGYDFVGNIGIHKPEEHGMMKILWVFYASKILEMGDTIIMVLKKNFHQISFLHMYHHTTIFLIWWFIIFGYPCGDSYFSAAQNSFVHVVMYSYYFMSLLKLPTPWKRIITYVQMLQFVLNVTQASYYLYWLKREPALPMQILLYYCISLLFLFYNYLVQSQKREKREKKGKSKAE